MAVEQDFLEIYGARVHNLKNIDLTFPRNKLVVITGLSGSGKSSLAFDTIYAEGQRRYLESFSAYSRQFLGNMERPDVDKISGLSPVISIEQKTTGWNPRSTLGTVTEVYDLLRLFFARASDAYSYISGKKLVKFSEEEILAAISKDMQGSSIMVLSPIVKGRKGHYKELRDQVRKQGYTKVRIDGEITPLSVGLQVDRYKAVSYTHLRAHETVLDLVCRLLLEKKKINIHSLWHYTSTEHNNNHCKCELIKKLKHN